MPITLSNTTISGLGVGGLPSGTVNADSLASSAVTAAKMGYSGAVLQTVFGYSNSRTTWSGDNSSDFTATITPSSASNDILIMGVLHGHANDDSISYLTASIGGGGYNRITSNGGNGVGSLGGWADHSWSHRSNSGPFPAPCFAVINFNTTSSVTIRWNVNAESTFYQNRGDSGAFGWTGDGEGVNAGVAISTLILQEIKR